ncbi:MAG: hypothetical protein LBS76_03550 [Mycoplasmataceae bacterium]|nr:hypothetical protein [Mycoplasmataceae bacterium]
MGRVSIDLGSFEIRKPSFTWNDDSHLVLYFKGKEGCVCCQMNDGTVFEFYSFIRGVCEVTFHQDYKCWNDEKKLEWEKLWYQFELFLRNK